MLTLQILIDKYRKCLEKIKSTEPDEDEEEGELHELQQDLYGLARKIAILPTCCEESKAYPVIYLSYNKLIDPVDPNTPVGEETVKWAAKIHDDISLALDGSNRGQKLDWWDNTPVPKFCPYCGTKLPEPRRLTDQEIEEIGLPIHNQTDYYCDTCGDRNNECSCLPPWVKWTIDEETDT